MICRRSLTRVRIEEGRVCPTNAVVQVVLRLVDDQRHLVGEGDERQRCAAATARRELVHRTAV